MENTNENHKSIYAQRPDSVKRLRACLGCKIIKTESQFLQFACDNCPQPDLSNQAQRLEWMESNTTDDYEGSVYPNGTVLQAIFFSYMELYYLSFLFTEWSQCFNRMQVGYQDGYK